MEKTIVNPIYRIDPFDNNCIVLDLFDIFFDFKEKYNFKFNLNRYNYGGSHRFPSLIFDNSSDTDNVEKDFLDIVLKNIKQEEQKNPITENILFVWRRSYLSEIYNDAPFYQKVNPLETIDFIKFNKKKFLESLTITTEVINLLDPGLPEIGKHNLSGTYPTTHISVSQDCVISYAGKTEDHHPYLSKKYLKGRYAFLEPVNPNPDIRFPVCGFLYTDNVAAKYNTAAFKESCSILAFEIYKDIDIVPEFISKENIISDYKKFLLDPDKIEVTKLLIENDLQIIFNMPKPAYNSLYNSVSHALELINFLKHSGLNPNNFVCTRQREFVNDNKTLICKDPSFDISCAFRDKVTPYDILVVPKTVFFKTQKNKSYLKEVQSIITSELIDNELFIKKNGNISINKKAKIPCVPVSLKESEAMLGKGLSFFFSINKKYPKYYLNKLGIQNTDTPFTEDNFTRGKKSLEILDRYLLANEFAKFITDISLGTTKDFAKRILIYGIHIKNKQINNLSQICKTETEKYILLEHLNLFDFDKEFDYWGIIDWREHINKSDNNRLFNFRDHRRASDIEILQKIGSNQGKLLENVNDVKVLEFKVLALALVSLIQEFNEQTIKELVNYCMCKNFGQIFLFLKANLIGKNVYPGHSKIENAHLAGCPKDEIIKHYKDFPDITWKKDNWNNFELRDVFDKKETKIYHLPVQIATTQTDYITFSLHTSTNRPSISASDK